MSVRTQNGEQESGIEIRPEPDGSGNARVVLRIDDVDVSWCWIVPMTLRIGVADVRMDGIGGVGTEESQRNRGYSRRVLTAAVEEMKRGDAALTTLYGIPDYYPRWGYATVGHEGDFRLTRLDRNNLLPDGYRWRFAGTADLTAIRSLYSAESKAVVGAVVRDPGRPSARALATSLETGDNTCIVVVDSTDRVVAYAWMASFIWWMENVAKPRDADGLLIGEAFASGPLAADALLAALRQWAVQVEKSHVAIHQPPVGHVGLAARLQDVDYHARSTRAQEYMGRSTGIQKLMTALEPELVRRWASQTLSWTGLIELRTPEDRVQIDLETATLTVVEADDDRAATIVDLSVGDIARLALGTFPPLEFLARSGVTGPVANVLAALFPQGAPYIYPADRF